MIIKKLEEIYNICLAEGIIKKKDIVDVELAKSLLESAKEEFEISKQIEESVKYYSVLFKGKYDILRELISAFILFDKIRIDNHQCINAYLCMKYPKLDMDWEILETLRLLRNAINYEGKKIEETAWKTHKIQFEIYIRTFIKEVEKKVENLR